jgi:hypothetical protein
MMVVVVVVLVVVVVVVVVVWNILVGVILKYWRKPLRHH